MSDKNFSSQQKEGGVKHEVLEAEIRKLAEEIKAIKIKAEKNHLSEEEIIKKSLSALTPIPQKPTVQSQPSPGPLPSYAQSFPPEVKLEIEYLLDLAFHEGIVKALQKAQETNNPAIIDAFHDALVGKLYQELKERKIL